jgi:hypothetical protein
MEYTFTNLPVPPPPRQQTWPEAQIEANAKVTRQLYYLPAPTSELEHWYLDEILEPLHRPTSPGPLHRPQANNLIKRIPARKKQPHQQPAQVYRPQPPK